jgi:hypothetical protein
MDKIVCKEKGVDIILLTFINFEWDNFFFFFYFFFFL